MFDWISQNKDWLFSGAAIAVIALFFKLITSYLWPIVRREVFNALQNQINSAANEQGPNIIKTNPEISRQIDLNPDLVSLYFVTFKPNENEIFAFEERWIEHKRIKIPTTQYGFTVRKEEIIKELKDINDPYKFYLEVNNTAEEKHKYYSRLIESEFTVTGKGSIDHDNPAKWRIWFLVNNEPIHPDIEGLVQINHSLINRPRIAKAIIYGVNKKIQPISFVGR